MAVLLDMEQSKFLVLLVTELWIGLLWERTQNLRDRLSSDDFLGIVVAKGERIFRSLAFEGEWGQRPLGST